MAVFSMLDSGYRSLTKYFCVFWGGGEVHEFATLDCSYLQYRDDIHGQIENSKEFLLQSWAQSRPQFPGTIEWSLEVP